MAARTIAGGCHEPSPAGRPEGAVVLGQYRRITRYISPFGAGNQLDSLSAPGESFWICNVREPSGFFFRPGSIGELIRYRLIGFSISNWLLPSYIVTDQNASTGGNWLAAKVTVYLDLEPSSLSPLASVFVIG